MLIIKRAWGQEILLEMENRESVLACLTMSVGEDFTHLRFSGDLQDFDITMLGSAKVADRIDHKIFLLTYRARLKIIHKATRVMCNIVLGPMDPAYQSARLEFEAPKSLKIIRTELLGAEF